MITGHRIAVMQFVKTCVVGVIQNTIGYLVYLSLTWSWFDPKTAVTITYPVGFIIGYYGHFKYSFSYKGNHYKGTVRYIIAHVLGYLTNISILYIFYDLMGFDHRAVQIFAIGILVVFFFLLYKYFVFPKTKVQAR